MEKPRTARLLHQLLVFISTRSTIPMELYIVLNTTVLKITVNYGDS